MGTRHLTLVQLDSAYPVAQYGQWDGYPSGQGETVLTFLKSISSDYARAKFKRALRKLKHLTEDEVKMIWELNGQLSPSNLSRDTGADILGMVHKDEVTEVYLQTDFAKDSIMCEYAYLVNLDDETLEVYRGFNVKPLPAGARFYCGGYVGEHEYKNPDGSTYHYYPIRLVKTYPLKRLPSQARFEREINRFR